MSYGAETWPARPWPIPGQNNLRISEALHINIEHLGIRRVTAPLR